MTPFDGDVIGRKHAHTKRLMYQRHNGDDGPWEESVANAVCLGRLSSSLCVSARVALSSLQVPSHPETAGQLLPGGCRLTGHNSRSGQLDQEDQARQAVLARQEVPSAHPDHLDHTQVSLALL